VIQSVDRAVRVLSALQGSRRMTLTELAAALGLPASTVHGIVKRRVGHGMVVQERGSSRYMLGPRVLLLGNVYLDTLELRSRTAPWAAELARRTGYAVRTGVLLLDEIVIIHHEPRPDGSRQMPEVGIVIPAYASALGKAVSAFSAEARKAIGEAMPFRSMTGETLTDLAALESQWDDVATTGVALEAEEAVLGECALASPIFDAFDGVVGAIGVVVPSTAWPTEPQVREAHRETARTSSRELGAPTWPGTSPS
jgi:DNA-binding IclR family transcriptional regulator